MKQILYNLVYSSYKVFIINYEQAHNYVIPQVLGHNGEQFRQTCIHPQNLELYFFLVEIGGSNRPMCIFNLIRLHLVKGRPSFL